MIECGNRPALQDPVFRRNHEQWSIAYVWNSGTVIQYFQLWKAWMNLLEYERMHGKFDIVVRWRTDVILTETLDLSKLTTNSDELTCRSMGNDRIRKTVETRTTFPTKYEHPIGHPFNDNVVWTLGWEQAWIAKRDTFALFGPMIFTYGCWDSGLTCAFNSETFFHEFCNANGITHWGFFEPDHPFYSSPDNRHQFVISIVR